MNGGRNDRNVRADALVQGEMVLTVCLPQQSCFGYTELQMQLLQTDNQRDLYGFFPFFLSCFMQIQRSVSNHKCVDLIYPEIMVSISGVPRGLQTCMDGGVM